MGPCAAVFVAVSTAFAVFGPLQSDEPAPRPAASDAASADREALTAHESERPARTNAALNLLEHEPAFLAETIRTSESDEIVLAVLEALRIRAASAPAGEGLIEAVLARAASDGNGVAMDARETLRTLDGAAKDAVRPRLLAALRGEDAARAEAAIDVLARTGDLAVVEPLLGVLEQSGGAGPLAEAAGAALSELLGPRLGADHAAWRAFWKECVGKTRVRILRDVLAQERREHAHELERKDREIVRLEREQDGSDAQKLMENLEHDIAGVRKFSAELLARGFPEADLQAVRPVVLARLHAGAEPPSGEAAFLRLLAEIDARAGRNGPDADRDAIVARALSSASSEVVLAAVEVAAAFPMKQVRDAALDALRRMAERGLSVTARIALVEAAGHGKLNLPAGLDALRELLRQDESVDVRVACVSTLGSLKVADSAPDLVHALARDPDWRVRRRAAGALLTVAGASALEALLAAMEDPRAEVRSEAVVAVAAVGDGAAVGALLERLAREESPAVRAAIAQALGILKASAALEPLAELMRAPVAAENGGGPEAAAAVRDEVRGALARIAADDPERWARVAALVGDADPPLLARAESRRFELLEAAGADRATRQKARLRACRALLAIGEHEKVVALATATGDPDAGEDPAPYAELVVLEGRARLAGDEASVAARAFERALAFPSVSPAQRFAWSVDLADALEAAGDAAAAKRALPSGPPPEGVAERDVERREELLRRFGELESADPLDGAAPPESSAG